METIRLTTENEQECARRAAEVLRAGGVVIYPTDTLYGLGADAFSDEAVEKIYRIKARDESRPVHCVVTDIEMASQYAEINETARKLAEKFFPGPLTIVVEKKSEVQEGIARHARAVGFRIPKNDFCGALARELGKPYTTTSANVSGKPTMSTVSKILEQFGRAGNEVDLVIDAGELPKSFASTVVRVLGSEIRILREGAIPSREIKV